MNAIPPTIGRIVGYRPIASAVDKQVRPAMIVEVYTDPLRKPKDRVALQVFSPLGGAFIDADWSDEATPGTWFWLPKVQHRTEAQDETLQQDPADPVSALPVEPAGS